MHANRPALLQLYTRPCPALHPRWTPVKWWVKTLSRRTVTMRPSPLAACKDRARPAKAARVGARPTLEQAK